MLNDLMGSNGNFGTNCLVNYLNFYKTPFLFFAGREILRKQNRLLKMLLKICLLFLFLHPQSVREVNGLIEDVIDVLYLSREVIKTISSTWELADQVGVTNEIDLPFMQRKEKKIFARMAELTQEFRNAEMMVIKRLVASAFNCR